MHEQCPSRRVETLLTKLRDSMIQSISYVMHPKRAPSIGKQLVVELLHNEVTILLVRHAPRLASVAGPLGCYVQGSSPNVGDDGIESAGQHRHALHGEELCGLLLDERQHGVVKSQVEHITKAQAPFRN
jgi:hypothetical protein